MQNTFFSFNRQNISKRLNGALVVLTGYRSIQRQNDMAFRFQQEANFWYLTGIEHSDWLVVIDGSTGEEWLVQPKLDDTHEVFDGSLSAEQATATSGIKKVISHDESMALLRLLSKKHSVVYTIDAPAYADQFSFTLNPAVSANKKKLERIFASVVDCQKELAVLRAIKQPEEIKAIQRAVKLTIDGFSSVKNKLAIAKFEYELEAEFSYNFKSNGGHDHAYDPIVAAGMNACTLHYVNNSDPIRTRQFVLMDVGARVDGYAADITRTYIKGTPTKRQIAVHGAVERAHHAIIRLLEPDLSIESYQAKVSDIMTNVIVELGLSNGDNEKALRRYFPHAISHGLGIDVHDSLGAPRVFLPNMVLTVEPGIYIPEEGIGVRIEDDILITDTGHKNLSGALSTVL